MLVSFNKIFSFIDDKIKKKPKLLNFLVCFFDKTSRITSSLLFDVRFYLPICLVSVCMFILRTEELLVISDFFRVVGFTKNHLIYAFKNIIPMDLIFFLIFYSSIVQIIFLNMFLISIKSIRNAMILKYDPLIIKKRGYNMIGSSVSRVASLGGMCLAGYCADLWFKDREQQRWAFAQEQENTLARDQERPPYQIPQPWSVRQAELKVHVDAALNMDKPSK